MKTEVVADVTDRLSYTYEEALEAASKYFDGDELAAGVWLNKYALKDSYGNIYERTPEDMHHRMAAEIARVEKKYPNPMSEAEVFEVLNRFKYIVPQGGPMTGIGNEFQVASLSNCFVIGNDGTSDSYGGVMKIDEEQVQLMKRRGGVGHDLSHIRPKGSPVKNSALTATGVVPFMERYSNSTREVAQDGRRGALMLSISIDHPDSEAFIDAKLDGTKVTGANVSVRITDAFMKAAVSGEKYTQAFPIGSKDPLITKEVDARSIWNKIIHNAWASAEPGILFWDTIIRESVPDSYKDLGFETVSTNPCGEIPLCPYDSCRLLAINLLSYVENPFSEGASFNFEKFKEHAKIAQRIADDIIDLELEKIDAIMAKIKADPESEDVKRTEFSLWEKIKEKCIQGRRTGIGITAEGDMLAALGLRYGSEESLDFTEEVHKTLAVEVYRGSMELAKDRGAFGIFDWELEKENPFLARLGETDPELLQNISKHGRRNIALLTIAPTGTTSLMTQTTSGIEPVFMVSYKRRKKINPNDKNTRTDFVDDLGDHWQEFFVFHHQFANWLKLNGYDLAEVEQMEEDALNEIIAKSPYAGSTARDVDWVNKVHLQGRVQKWVDHSISVTVNVPEDTTEEKVNEIYRTGWESGCKGITIYRDGSRSGVLVENKKKEEKEEGAYISEQKAPARPQILEADVVRFNNNEERWLAVIGLLNDRPYEIFTGRAEDSFHLPYWCKTGYVMKSKDADDNTRYDFQYKDKDDFRITIEGLSRSFNPEFWNYAKLISGVLRHGMPLLDVVHMVENLHLSDESLNTWKNGVVRALKKYIPNGTKAVESTCGECGEDAVIYQEGCLICKSCGNSKCG
ncbi:ribonucleoside-diphosphate reductase, adenosylcobalamin-dependent [Owenweeksia hongkongensis DSM 17368]|uniref:Vitamin B12-dependent ribonucleotide reductase n=1 Tax=Owenweeksia hongkongensis (strain DSM 17368 / CIP 108786 / JCM 12287 / NRRL B-23963 / UST20020801) TaxID=926562 RepID=G8QZ95_OWEHD|nr:adenosylcobalamin-dependent ribonucleoside-diphosphate reductase [Owenweeksia hongkongensis]AEV31478.1 ribonucleoside-diphosphate reductase, adenosylcobalamin-dependent [Owenweeksia hongkongensis DSM 17368]